MGPQSSMARELIRGKETQGQTQGRRPCDNTEIRMIHPQAKEHQRTPEARREHVPFDTLILGFYPTEQKP